MSTENKITVTIDGTSCEATRGDTILSIARANGISIPTMCYLTKVSPIASCRMCVVEIENVDGMILSCQERAVDGAVITTKNAALEAERAKIMNLYGVNHPLECGVCDKSGECDLQNKTLEYGLKEQPFAAKDQYREVQDWGFITYNPSLCIMCEKCVSVSNEITGDASLQIKFGGYSSTIINNNPSKYNMALGEAASVCPVGALVNSDYKYSTNAWELEKIPASCPHCSGGCQIYYETKNDKVYRVTNEYEYGSICSEARYNFNFENRDVAKDREALSRAVAAFQNADSVIFNSKITNEEALILQKLKQKLGFRLVNHDAYMYQRFMDAFASAAGKSLYGGVLSDVADSDAILVLGTRINDDSDQLKYHISKASKHNTAKVIYMHPIEDVSMQNQVTQFIKYEVGSEEAVMALLADGLLNKASIDEHSRNILKELDIGNLSAESNVGEEELEVLMKSLERKKKITFIAGADLYTHERAENIARFLGLIQRELDVSIIIAPHYTNTLGASLICDLEEEVSGKSVGYNVKADFVLSSMGDGDIDMPALNQQEGTFTSMDKCVVPTNAALSYGGYCLNDIANELGLKAEYTISYTNQLPIDRGYKMTEFDTLPDYYDNTGKSHRGYTLETIEVDTSATLEDADELDSYDGLVAYNCNAKEELARFLRPSNDGSDKVALLGSKQFSMMAKINDGDEVNFEIDGVRFQRMFRVSESLKGTVALNPIIDMGLQYGALKTYRFNKIKLERAEI